MQSDPLALCIKHSTYHAPLYGRMTAQLQVKPLPFSALREFYPHYTAAERVAVYAILGGVPAYLERFNDQEALWMSF